MAANHGSFRKKVACFKDIVSFGLTTNSPKEAKGMACDILLQRIIADSHGASVPFRAIPLLSYFVYGFLHRSLTDVFCVSPCHSVAMIFCLCFLHRSFTDIHGCFPCDSVAQTIAFDVGCNRIYTEHPCDSVKIRCYEIKGA